MTLRVTILRCSVPGAWWERHIGRTIRVFATDSYGHWTRDTNKPGAKGWAGYPFLQWVRTADTTRTFGGEN